MKTRNILAMALASAVLLTGFTGCGKQNENTDETEPETLPVEVAEVTEIEYYQPEDDAGLAPPIPLRLRGVSYEVVTVNTNVFHFNTQSFKDFLTAANTTVDGTDIKDIENSDFRFHGFALKSGSTVQMYAELTKDGELVEEYNKADLDSYEVKALYTSAELLGAGGSYFSCGTRVFTGLQKYEIETMNGKGYTSGFDSSTFYYPDVEGWTMGLTYLDGTFTANPAADASGNNAAELLDENGQPIPQAYLSELYLFRGDALVIEPTE